MNVIEFTKNMLLASKLQLDLLLGRSKMSFYYLKYDKMFVCFKISMPCAVSVRLSTTWQTFSFPTLPLTKASKMTGRFLTVWLDIEGSTNLGHLPVPVNRS